MLSQEMQEIVGTPGEGVTHFKLQKKLETTWRRCEWPVSGIYLSEWPIEELNLDRIREQWKAGEYRTTWLKRDPHNKDPDKRFAQGGMGKRFRVDDLAQPAPEPIHVAPVPLDPMGQSLDMMMRLMGVIDQKSAGTIDMVQKLAVTMGGSSSKGGEVMPVIMMVMQMQQQQQAQFTAQLAEQRRAAEQQHALLMARIEEIGEYEPEPLPAQGGAGSPVFEAGTPFWETAKALLLNVAVEAAPAVLSAMATARAAPTQAPPPQVPPILVAAPPVAAPPVAAPTQHAAAE